MDEPKTIIGFKIRGTKKNKEIFWGLAILMGLLLGIALFGFVQVKFCQSKTPDKSWQDCIARNRVVDK